MQILFKNETTISKKKVNKTEKYAKVHKIKLLDITKIIMCIAIIICSIILLKKGKIETIIYIAFAMWGISDVYKNNKKTVKNGKIIYEFYDDFFEVKTEDKILQVDYDMIKKIISDSDTYYIILNKCGLFMDKDNFIIGKQDEILNFLKEKLVPIY